MTVSGLRLAGWRNLLTEMFGREADAVADEFLRDAVRASAEVEAILDYVSGMTEDEFAEDPKTIDAASFGVIVLGEAVNTLLADPSGKGRTRDARIITDHPEIPWKDWVGMRNLVTHQYFRPDHRVVWRDIASGEVGRLAAACRDWLNSRSPPPPVP